MQTCNFFLISFTNFTSFDNYRKQTSIYRFGTYRLFTYMCLGQIVGDIFVVFVAWHIGFSLLPHSLSGSSVVGKQWAVIRAGEARPPGFLQRDWLSRDSQILTHMLGGYGQYTLWSAHGCVAFSAWTLPLRLDLLWTLGYLPGLWMFWIYGCVDRLWWIVSELSSWVRDLLHWFMVGIGSEPWFG